VSITYTWTVDTEVPVITLIGNTTVSLCKDQPYTDAGATALDNCSGDITGDISTNNPVNTAVAGTYTVTYDVMDACGNPAVQVTRTVKVNVCLSGKLIAYNTNPNGVGTALVSVTGTQSGSMTTAADGLYSLAFSTGGNYTITPTKNINRTNGVDAADVSRIRQHINGTILFPNGYLMAAADVNKSNSINGTDVTLINQAILNLPAASFNTSWRFVPTSHTMAMPPWGFPEKRTLTGITTSQSNQDFYGIKLGDVVTTFANSANFNGNLVWYAQDQWLKTNEYVDVDFKPGALQDLMAFQFALQFDPGILEYVGHTNYGVLPMNDGCYGTVNVQGGTLRLLFAESKGYKVSGEAPVFRLRFKVRSGGRKLSNTLSVDFEEMQAVAYNSKFVQHDINLEFIQSTTAITEAENGRGTILYQNRPNPFNGRTEVRFKLPETTQATLTVYDVTGRTVFERSAVFMQGEHSIDVELSGVTSGLLYYRLKTPAGQWVRKMENINVD
jgi:hypothetical protein